MTDINFNIKQILPNRSHPLLVIAGPCVIESRDTCLEIADFMRQATQELGMGYVFKASYDKANRSAVSSFRGPGITAGLSVLETVRSRCRVPVISDIHSPEQAPVAAAVLDILQIPAFLCRQTDLILAAARTGRPLNLKKGQFMAPWDMLNVVKKARSVGNGDICITDRGTLFGYNNLVADFRGVPIMQQETGCPVIFDATHSVQLPGGAGDRSGGQREFAPVLARAAVAAGADGIFIEVHPDPDQALCDGPNSLPLEAVPRLLSQLAALRGCL